jgi:nicotinamidase-related amidase
MYAWQICSPGEEPMRADRANARAGQQTALLVVDLQRALCDAAPAAAMKPVTERIAALLEWAEARSWPIVFVQHWTEPGTFLDRGSVAWQLAEALSGHSSAFHLEKNSRSCFDGGKLDAWLRARSVSRLCITGMQSEYCISAACEGAAALGYDVILPVDGHMTIDGPQKSAAKIVAETNDRLGAFARCLSAANVMALEDDYSDDGRGELTLS